MPKKRDISLQEAIMDGEQVVQQAIIEGSPEWYEEYIPVELFKDNEKYSEPVFVGINGENCLIERGKRVMIKRKFAIVLEQSRQQDQQTAQLIEQYKTEYNANLKELV